MLLKEIIKVFELLDDPQTSGEGITSQMDQRGGALLL